MNAERLLNVAKALRESPNPDAFTMDLIHSCGSPACAIGHYVAREDLQQTFKINSGAWGFRLIDQGPDKWLMFDGPEICEHFGITPDEANNLFADGETDEDGEELFPAGCGNPASAIEAAEYIERFVAEHSGR